MVDGWVWFPGVVEVKVWWGSKGGRGQRVVVVVGLRG